MCIRGGIGREEQGEDWHDAVIPAYRRREENSVCPQTVWCVIFHLLLILHMFRCSFVSAVRKTREKVSGRGRLGGLRVVMCQKGVQGYKSKKNKTDRER